MIAKEIKKVMSQALKQGLFESGKSGMDANSEFGIMIGEYPIIISAHNRLCRGQAQCEVNGEIWLCWLNKGSSKIAGTPYK